MGLPNADEDPGLSYPWLKLGSWPEALQLGGGALLLGLTDPPPEPWEGGAVVGRLELTTSDRRCVT